MIKISTNLFYFNSYITFYILTILYEQKKDIVKQKNFLVGAPLDDIHESATDANSCFGQVDLLG